jgi:ubiquinone/menaquinone biosynthesis C-methylase UbiE
MTQDKPRSEAIPLPPEKYMELVGVLENADLPEQFERVGKNILEGLKNHDMLRANDRVLDVGCGCGRFARQLLNEPIRSYIGFDRHPGMIEWCQQKIQRHAPNFEFLYFDIKSAYSDKDGYRGKIDAASFRFPFDDDSFDFALLASIFTHMPLAESKNYLRELHRVLSREGRIVLSVFFTEGEPYAVEDINFYYRPQSFWVVVKETGFQYQLHEEITYGESHHNWHILTKP